MAANSKPKHRRKRATREEYFVLADQGDSSYGFFNATSHIGRPMPFKKPHATCAMRVSDTAVAFSVLRVTKASTKKVVERPIQIPRGPLARLERRSDMHDADGIDTDTLIVEISVRTPNKPDKARTEDVALPAPTADLAEPAGPSSVGGPAATDGAGGLEDLFGTPPLTIPDDPAPMLVSNPVADPVGEDEPDGAQSEPWDMPQTGASAVTGEDPSGFGLSGLFETPVEEPAPKPEKPKRVPPPMTTTVYRCRIGRDENNVAFLEEDGDESTLIEVPRGALNVSLYLKSPKVGRMIAVGFMGPLGRKPGTQESVVRVASLVLSTVTRLTEFRVLADIEAVNMPSEPAATWAARTQQVTDAKFPVRVELLDEMKQPVAAGDITVIVDLVNANPTTNRLLIQVVPDEQLAAVFDPYAAIVESAVTQAMRTHLGDDQITDITFDVVLGSVDDNTVDRIQDVATTITLVQATPTQHRLV